jgi:SNF2-related domain
VPQESDLLLGETRLTIVVAGSRRHSFEDDCMERKAIQIVANPDHLYALCDDGAIFQQSQGEWFELAPIPHTEKTGLTEAEITERIKEKLYNLLTLLKPGIFKTLKEFRAAHMTPGKPRQPANPERLRELIRAAMVRNTRAVVALKLPRRHAVTIRVDGSESERAAYQELATAARRLAAEGSSKDRLVLHHLLGAAGSSPTAATAAVKRLAGRRADEPGWHALAQRWASAGNGGKEAALLELLRRNPDEKKLVFVH